MFVRQSTYNKALKKINELQLALSINSSQLDYTVDAFHSLQARWNALVGRINEKGGEGFLEGESAQLTQAEIRQLLQLCHPDKHDGKQLAVDMTHRLLQLRKT